MAEESSHSRSPIAIVGVSALFPGSTHKQAFWRSIVDGRDFIGEIPADHWLVEDYYDPDPAKPGKIYTKRGAFLPKVPFNPMEFGLPPSNLPSTDSVQLLALLGTKRLMAETRSLREGRVARKDVSVILGIGGGSELIGDMVSKIQRPHWTEGMRRAGIPEAQVQAACDAIAATYPEWNEATFPGLLPNVAAGRVANRFDFGGANCSIDAACASSLAALAMAIDELRLGRTDLAIGGGCDALNDIFMFMCFTRTPAMSRAGDCRPFSDAADGTLLGEGVGLFALRRLADAERDGDTIYAVIKGVGASSDGSAKSVYAPRAEGQAEAIRRALDDAGVRPEDIELIEAHGTATKAGDVAEVGGLRHAFSSAPARPGPWCALGSIKSQIGHTKSAAGAAGLFKAMMALQHKVLPPTIKIDRPNPALELERSPFYLNTRPRPWIRAAGQPRRAGLSSFGFGGSNFHLTLEEYAGPARAPRISTARTQLVLLAAESVAALLARVAALGRDLDTGTPLAGLARASQAEFRAEAPHRLALLATDARDFADLAALLPGKLAAAGAGLALAPRAYYSSAPAVARGGLAFLFPGQGSQYVGMGAELAMEFEAARAVWDRAAASVPAGATPWHELVFPPPSFAPGAAEAAEARLTRTEHAQPALGLTSLSQLAVLTRAGVQPDLLGGHSYGELVALHAAGAIPDEATLVALSAARGRCMAAASAATPGAMTAIVGAVAGLDELLARVGGGLVVANRNSPQQVVVAGPVPAIAALEERLAAERRTFHRLPVATAFHSPLVAGAAESFARELAAAPLAAPRIPVFANRTAQPYAADVAALRATLAAQLAEPVLFQAQIEAMHAAGARLFLEVGPRAVLTRLVGQILGERPHVALSLEQKGRDGVSAFFAALGQLSVHGIAVDYAALWADFEAESPDPARQPLPRGAVWVDGANLGKPYPPPNGAAGRTPPQPVSPAAPRPAPPPAPAAAPAAPTIRSSLPPMSATPSPSPSESAQRYALLEQVQRNVLEAQRHFQDTLAQSHLAFLQTSEALLRQIAGAGGASLNGHAPSPLPVKTLDAAPLTLPVAPSAPAAPRALPRPAAPAVAVVPAPREVPSAPVPPPPARVAPIEEAPSVSEMSAPSRLPALESAPRPAAAPAAAPAKPAATDYQAIIVETIATTTGYPADMIELDMELEAGLGIDSIKKVEIFAALQGKIPELAQADTGQVSNLGTIRAILEFTQSLTGQAPAGSKKN